jgi:hypothetical protein
MMDCWISKEYHDYSALLSARVQWQMSTAMDLVNGNCGDESLLLSEANIAASMKNVPKSMFMDKKALKMHPSK